jgi:hypothetical protein
VALIPLLKTKLVTTMDANIKPTTGSRIFPKRELAPGSEIDHFLKEFTDLCSINAVIWDICLTLEMDCYHEAIYLKNNNIPP